MTAPTDHRTVTTPDTKERSVGILGNDVSSGLVLGDPQYPWAMKCYHDAMSNTWLPQEVPMGEDKRDWQQMTQGERDAVTHLMSYFNPSELSVNKALAFGVYQNVQAPEAHLYLARQMFEEANHCMTFEYVISQLQLDRKKAYDAHVEVPEMIAKERFALETIEAMLDRDLDITTLAGKQAFVRNLVRYNICLEGIFFYSGFLLALSFRRGGRLRNFGTLIDWVVRDESLHLRFGLNLILTVLEENPEIATDEFVDEIHDTIVHAVELEDAYNRAVLPKGILGLNAEYINQYVRFLADRRLEELGFEPHFNVTNPATWMTQNDLNTLHNFFERPVNTYERISGDNLVGARA